MGKGLMLGLLDGLGDILGKVFGGLFTFLVNTLIVPVVQAAIRVVIIVVQYFTSTVFYEVSKFLLGMIDFVEVLFRALAGLPSNVGPDKSITMSFGSKQGDLLIQMLTSKEVMQVFYATAIVGVFLLIITTIFQMIKVEYTTEGAQNSKSGIIGKSLKSLCNMLIIPVLCVFGVFVGNQILDLIDTATSGANGAKISGQLWVAAASSALVDEGSFEKALTAYGVKDLDNEGGLLGAGITLAVTKGFQSILDPKGAQTPVGVPFSGTADARSKTENDFITCTKSYYDVETVIKYYNPFEVNYIVLILGAVLILKCLYHTCFGLISRLYYCVALFIVMPMVVGMSPVKDSLGTWRSNFMKKVLSAYGVVISLNLFFIIVKLLLNINIKFGSYYDSKAWVFSPTFMEGLIKSIMVIVGCQMIEKLADEMGGYFGGGNAMSEGAGIAKQATATAMKAASVGMGVTALTGKAIVGGAKMAGGIANKVGHGINNLSGGRIGDLGNKVANSKFGQGVASMGKGVADFGKGIGQGVSNKVKSAKNWINDKRAGVYGAKKAEDNLAAEEKELDRLKTEQASGAQISQDAIDNQEAKVKKAKAVVTKNEERRELRTNLDNEAKAKIKQKVSMSGEALRKMAGDKFGSEALFKNVAPKWVQDKRKEYTDAYTAANSVSDEGKQILENKKKAKADAEKDAYEKRNRGWIEARNREQAGLTIQAMDKGLERVTRENNDQLAKLNTLLGNLGKQYAAAGDDEALKTSIAQRAGAVQQQMEGINSKIEFDGAFKVKSDDMLKVALTMDEDFKKSIAEQIKKGVKLDDIMAQINDKFKDTALNSPKTLEQLYKILEELKGKLG